MNPSGVVIVKKESGPTSQRVVSEIKRIFGTKTAGHTGTLDPLADGVLPVLVGRAVKASEFMLTADKHYRATLLLGVETDTEDITGEVIMTSEQIPEPERVFEVIRGFVGKISQTPPMYSALKVGGKKLCDLARRGLTVEREAREVEIYSIDAEKISEREYVLDVHCSKGTYIRTLCADIGRALGSGGTMKSLTRTVASGFALSAAHTLDELRSMSKEELARAVIPTEEIFKDKRAVKLSDFYARLAHSGLEIYLSKIGVSLECGSLVRMYDSLGFFALGEVREYEGGRAIKPIRQFRLD